MIVRWIVGTVIGTAIVFATSPLFVRSYVPRVYDQTRAAVVLQPESNYRWRNEGYASTRIGPLGMPGQESLPADSDGEICVALWGDSQAEGVCVADDEKLSAVAASLSRGRVRVLPMARSGDTSNNWLSQIQALEKAKRLDADDLQLKAHVFLVSELSDWCVEPRDSSESVNELENIASSRLPAALIQAGRNLLTDGQTSERRHLRFRLGPVERTANEKPIAPSGDVERRTKQIRVQLGRLGSLTDQRCVFLYAPRVPAIVQGKIQRDDPDDDLFNVFKRLCEGHSFQVIDTRPLMKQSVLEGRWPRGFHNGQFGVGHYNRIGYEIIARELVRCVDGWNDLE